MELSDSFEVNHPIATVWGVLIDVEQIAPCLPGAQLTGTEGDEFHGLVKVKVGPVTSQYKGKASFTELDEASHRAVITASGRDTRGAGNASAKITVALEPVDGTSTTVSVHTDLTVTGKVAQFGRGVLADVSRKLMGQFAGNLAALMEEQQSGEATADAGDDSGETAADSDAAAPASPGGQDAVDEPAAAASAPSTAPQEVEAVDLLAVAGGSVMKRLVPVLVVLAVVVIVVVVALSA